MPIRYIGREPFHKGKSLYEICRQLRDLGVGRIVYEKSVQLRFPTQKSYYRLTKVVPDMTCPEFCKGTAWGEQVFRGKEMGTTEITTGHQYNWIMVPKEEEEEFCANTEVFDVEKVPVPTHIDCPPLLQIVLAKEMKARGEKVPDKLEVPFVKDNYLKDIEWH